MALDAGQRSRGDAYAPLLDQAATLAKSYLAGLDARPVGVTAAALEGLRRLDGPLPSSPQDPAMVLALLDEAGSPATMATMGARFFGWVIGGALPVTVAAHWLADAWDQNACLHDCSPAGARLDEIVLGWLVELFGLPRGVTGA